MLESDLGIKSAKITNIFAIKEEPNSTLSSPMGNKRSCKINILNDEPSLPSKRS